MSASTDPNTQSSSNSADSPSLTWTDANQDMLDNLTGQSDTISQFVTLSQNLEAVTRLFNEVMSPENRTAFLREARTSIMKLGVDWKTRGNALSTKLYDLDSSLATAKIEAAKLTGTNNPTQPTETDLRSAAERCRDAVVVLRDKCSESKAANTAVSLAQLNSELDEWYGSTTNLDNTIKHFARSWYAEYNPGAGSTSGPE
ncbi:hypothetical protein EHS25_006075 [Saitozyma podzolica]|uniref:Uncharacterized protein n=1 Tax=Saitozyma podzolica TaxID=1890683 RepID=A0A427XTB0_9TREE|nr:hypothetical protein EHS25_006075 [Saitozyma podzolica]